MRNILSIIFELREIIKENLTIKIEKKITNILAENYKPYQNDYQKILNNTIDLNNIKEWATALRHKILHGGIINFYSIRITQSNNTIINIWTDYDLIDELSKKKLGCNFKYYIDMEIHKLQLINNGILEFNKLPEEEQVIIRKSIETRVLKQDQSDLNINELLKNEDFILSHYNIYKQNGAEEMGKFGFFNFSMLIDEICSAYKTCYEDIYQLICKAENKKLIAFMELQNKIKTLNNPNLKITPISFQLTRFFHK